MAARVVPLTRELAKRRIAAAWWAELATLGGRLKQEPDHHWNWTKLVADRQNKWSVECAAVQTDDGDVQAAIVYVLNTASVLDTEPDGKAAPAVYCEFVATAPRNRKRLVQSPLYRGGGSSVLVRAIARSYSFGFGGRINLASLPHPDTEKFYDNFGFIRTDVVKDGMVVYELSPEQAQGRLRETGLL